MAAMLLPGSASITQERPRGLALIAVLCWVVAAVSLGFAAGLWAHAAPLSSGAALLGGGLEQLGPLAFVLYGLVTGTLGTALWRRWKGSRRAAILLAAAGIALSASALSSAVSDGRFLAVVREGAQVMVRVLVIYYLSQEPVRQWFASR